MAKNPDAEKILDTLAHLWADQYGQTITNIKVTRRGSNEEIINSAGNRASNY